MNPNEEEHFLTTREAAQLLDVNFRTIQNWVEKGVLKAWKTPGGHRRVARSSIETLLEQRKRSLRKRSNKPDRRLLVLVVEDEEELQQIYQIYFDFWNLPVDLHLAKNGMEGLLFIGNNRPDLIITDLLMPGMDGFSMLKTLAKETDYSKIHLLVITRLNAEEIAQRGGVPEGVTIFHKPIVFEELEFYIRALVEKPRP